MYTHIAYNVYMKANTQKKQYTIRGVSAQVDKALHRIAKSENKSFNQVALDALTLVALPNGIQHQFHDLDFLIGSWQDDSSFDLAIEQQSKIDQELWK